MIYKNVWKLCVTMCFLMAFVVVANAQTIDWNPNPSVDPETITDADAKLDLYKELDPFNYLESEDLRDYIWQYMKDQDPFFAYDTDSKMDMYRETNPTTGMEMAEKLEEYITIWGMAGVPGFVLTGDMEADKARYQVEKAKYIQDHPQQYVDGPKGTTSSSSATVVTASPTTTTPQ
ncbi:MAG: hypothetical protein IIA45_10795 [Bacteroidetes bacterium]|nr:hypothetical protein [Bacteroidota bacterium]